MIALHTAGNQRKKSENNGINDATRENGGLTQEERLQCANDNWNHGTQREKNQTVESRTINRRR